MVKIQQIIQGYKNKFQFTYPHNTGADLADVKTKTRKTTIEKRK